MVFVDVRGLERDLRKLPGVVACAITDGGVSLLLAENIDEAAIAREASVIAGAYGAGAVRILESPGGRVAVARRRPTRARIAAGTAVAAAIALIASLVPVGRKVAPQVAPPAAIRPAPPPGSGGELPPVVIAAPRTNPVPVAPAIEPADAGTQTAPRRPTVSAAPKTPAPPKGGGTAVSPPVAQEDCEAPGTAAGRENREGNGNQSSHRHHEHSTATHDRPHWFECS